ncbi:MAG: heme lyase CcmF/NrfE family subunit [Bryobacterales bacterium]|nr:heme lyase CcmF/NrfE family subunit [Bryobacterales bacterium]
MENLGAVSVLIAFCLGVYALAASILGGWKRKPYLVASAERAVYALWLLLTVASSVVVHALLTGDFRMVYVASHSNRDMPALYKFAAWWGGQEGSLLLWSWLLASYAALVVLTNRRRHRAMMPFVTAVLMAPQVFFLILNAFVASPFRMLAVGREITSVPDGNGLNPLLQYWAMALHPPALYLGYVGFAVPFAFAMGALITREKSDSWLQTTRRWTLITWLFQSCGILLGAGWAYAVLGWGGYWGWDPVENASLLPWITATAFLHSVMMQEKKGMMKVWNVSLISITFWLCIFGTFLTRSGIVSSVHAFAQSPIGKWFVGFLAVLAAAVIYVILNRLDYLRSEARLESVVSRESSFLFNNLLLLASCFAVLWGTLFPVISEAFTGEKISVAAPFFNRVNVPIGLFLLFLTGVAPLFAWRRTSVASLRRNFTWPLAAAAVLAAGLFAAGVRHGYALVCFALCLFVAWTIGAEFYKGSRAIAARTGQNLLAAAVELTHRNPRRYGGYTVHMGIVLMFVGFAGSAFNKQATVEVELGSAFQLGRYELQVREIRRGSNPNYSWDHAVIGVSSGGKAVDRLEPERRLYVSSGQNTSEVAIRRRLNEDLYLNFAGMSADNSKAVIQAYVFPLVSWIWIGFLVLVGGTLVCLVPGKSRVKEAGPGVSIAEVEYAQVED